MDGIRSERWKSSWHDLSIAILGNPVESMDRNRHTETEGEGHFLGTTSLWRRSGLSREFSSIAASGGHNVATPFCTTHKQDLGNLNCTLLTHKTDYKRKRNLQLVCDAINQRWQLGLNVSERDDIMLGERKVRRG